MEKIDNSELLTRYLFEKNHFAGTDGRVKYGAFMPKQNEGTLLYETSVFRTLGLLDDGIWKIGLEFAQGDRKLKGRADITVQAVEDSRLQAIKKEPPERHADIVGWPSELLDQKVIARQLAASSELHLRHDENS
ncbi:MAG: hypothetical protein HY884_04220 [Deltaproteobacteria bacterium]|nr:hypothetical protein [Deltaproteobacteria bacterium]